jgi:hypothetical protein
VGVVRKGCGHDFLKCVQVQFFSFWVKISFPVDRLLKTFAANFLQKSQKTLFLAYREVKKRFFAIFAEPKHFRVYVDS